VFRKISVLIGLLLVALSQLGSSSPRQATEQGRGVSWWVWVLIVVVLLILLLWWWLRRPEKEVASPRAEPAAPLPAAEVSAPEAEPVAPAPSEVERPAPDDLKRIEGIGPKISTVLQGAGVTTFAQLAAVEVSRLEHIVRAAGIRLADPSTWPEQARLAAAGQWEALEALQNELKGGRRV
jgi:predicted flap endonuclease-1-like 5' DNA nuclease